MMYSVLVFLGRKGWILCKEKLQTGKTTPVYSKRRSSSIPDGFSCNPCFFTTGGEFSKSQPVSYFCWIPSGGFPYWCQQSILGEGMHLITHSHVKGWVKASENKVIFGFFLAMEKYPLNLTTNLSSLLVKQL